MLYVSEIYHPVRALCCSANITEVVLSNRLKKQAENQTALRPSFGHYGKQLSTTDSRNVQQNYKVYSMYSETSQTIHLCQHYTVFSYINKLLNFVALYYVGQLEDQCQEGRSTSRQEIIIVLHSNNDTTLSIIKYSIP